MCLAPSHLLWPLPPSFLAITLFWMRLFYDDAVGRQLWQIRILPVSAQAPATGDDGRAEYDNNNF